MAYLNPSDVFVFPSVQRNTTESRLFSEESVANLIANFINEDSFVIDFTEDSSDNANDGRIKFNIKGYYFNVSTNAVLKDASGAKEIAASITIGPSIGENSYRELSGVDDNDKYTGLNITYSSSTSDVRSKIDNDGTITYTLVLLRRDDTSTDNFYIPEDCKVRFEPSSVGLTEVDGGTWE